MESKNKSLRFAKKVIALAIVFAMCVVGLLFSSGVRAVYSLETDQASSKIYQNSTDENTVDNDSLVTLGLDLVVHFVDVGQGDATILELPDGKYMLIDAGDTGEEENLLFYIEENLVDAKSDEEKLETFDYVMLTHSDADHSGGIQEVLEIYGTDVFYRPNELATRDGFTDPGLSDLYSGYTSKSTLVYSQAIDAGYTYSNQVIVSDASDETSDTIEPDGIEEGEDGYYKIVLYSPIGNSYTDCNNYSPIMVVEYEGKRIALSGDAEEKAEEEFVEMVNDEKHSEKYDVFDEDYTVDVLKMGHHGSRTSTSQDYIDIMTTPSATSGILAIASCGEDNSYGHPHEEVLQRLTDSGFSEDNILRTDLDGDIVVSVSYDETDSIYKLYLGTDGDEVVGGGDDGSADSGNSGDDSGNSGSGGDTNNDGTGNEGGASSGNNSEGSNGSGLDSLFSFIEDLGLSFVGTAIIAVVVILVLIVAIAVYSKKSSRRKSRKNNRRRK